MGALLGLLLVIAGFAVSLTVIGAVIGIPLIIFANLYDRSCCVPQTLAAGLVKNQPNDWFGLFFRIVD